MQSKSFLGRIGLSRERDGQCTNDRHASVGVVAELGETFEKVFPGFIDLRRILHQMAKSRQPLPHDSRVESSGLDLFERSLREAVDETRHATDVRQDLLRREN